MSRRFCLELFAFIAVFAACACSKQPDASASKEANVALPPQAPSTKTIASNIYLDSGGGCESKTIHLSFVISNVGRIDPSYAGPVEGIEFVELTRVGKAGYRNVARNGDRLELDMFADGAGTKDNIPSIGDRCVDAAAASVGYDIVGHYR